MREKQVVNQTECDKALQEISKHQLRSLDTETTGLYAFHGDAPFSVAISTEEKDYYFNWQHYENLPSDLILPVDYWRKFQEVTKSGFWFIHNAKFDMAMMYSRGVSEWHNTMCTKVLSRLVHNDLLSYSLDACGARIGFKKDDTVKKYIKENKLTSKREREGKEWKQPRFDMVPFELVSEYAMRDAFVCLQLGIKHLDTLKERASSQAARLPSPLKVLDNERKLNKVLFEMERIGAKIDVPYCRRAKDYYVKEMQVAEEEFKNLTGVELVLSAKCLGQVFASEKDKFVFTAKRNFKFDSKVLATFENPAAKSVIRYKEAKSNYDFYQGFLFNADKEGVMHTTLDSGGTRTGRFASYEPNLQNMSKRNQNLEDEFVVRRAIIPRDGYFLAMIDYDQIEYRLMLDYANATGLIKKVKSGLDVHTATAESAECTRSQAKTVNFLTLYGGGIAKLAGELGTTNSEAKRIQDQIFNASPEVRDFIRNCIAQARHKGKITNWIGRTYFFDNKNFCYKAPNTLIQGGAGDIVKVAMVNLHDFLQDKKSRMLLNIHDELIFEIHESEEKLLPKIKEIMETAYPHRHLPLTCGIEFSKQSLADKQDWEV